MERAHIGAGEKHEEERTAERNCCGMTSIPCILCATHGGEDKGVGNEGEMLSLGRGEWFSFCLCFSPSHSTFNWQ